MTSDAVWLKMDGERVVQALEEAGEKLAGGDLALDFSSVRRLNPSAIRALERLAAMADGQAVKVVVRGVNVEVYKVLKLVRLTSRFSFAM
jgi:anti-anti-sigma regulatory factor